MTVAVERVTAEEVFRAEKTIPADDGILGEGLIEDAFEGTSDDRVKVQVWLDDEPAGTFDQEITCPADNRFGVLVVHLHYSPDDGEPVNTSLTGGRGERTVSVEFRSTVAQVLDTLLVRESREFERARSDYSRLSHIRR